MATTTTMEEDGGGPCLTEAAEAAEGTGGDDFEEDHLLSYFLGGGGGGGGEEANQHTDENDATLSATICVGGGGNNDAMADSLAAEAMSAARGGVLSDSYSNGYALGYGPAPAPTTKTIRFVLNDENAPTANNANNVVVAPNHGSMLAGGALKNKMTQMQTQTQTQHPQPQMQTQTQTQMQGVQQPQSSALWDRKTLMCAMPNMAAVGHLSDMAAMPSTPAVQFYAAAPRKRITNGGGGRGDSGNRSPASRSPLGSSLGGSPRVGMGQGQGQISPDNTVLRLPTHKTFPFASTSAAVGVGVSVMGDGDDGGSAQGGGNGGVVNNVNGVNGTNSIAPHVPSRAPSTSSSSSSLASMTAPFATQPIPTATPHLGAVFYQQQQQGQSQSPINAPASPLSTKTTTTTTMQFHPHLQMHFMNQIDGQPHAHMQQIYSQQMLTPLNPMGAGASPISPAAMIGTPENMMLPPPPRILGSNGFPRPQQQQQQPQPFVFAAQQQAHFLGMQQMSLAAAANNGNRGGNSNGGDNGEGGMTAAETMATPTATKFAFSHGMPVHSQQPQPSASTIPGAVVPLPQQHQLLHAAAPFPNPFLQSGGREKFPLVTGHYSQQLRQHDQGRAQEHGHNQGQVGHRVVPGVTVHPPSPLQQHQQQQQNSAAVPSSEVPVLGPALDPAAAELMAQRIHRAAARASASAAAAAAAAACSPSSSSSATQSPFGSRAAPTAAETAERRARRLARNRESARQSRRRKKELLLKLGGKVNGLYEDIYVERRRRIMAMEGDMRTCRAQAIEGLARTLQERRNGSGGDAASGDWCGQGADGRGGGNGADDDDSLAAAGKTRGYGDRDRMYIDSNANADARLWEDLASVVKEAGPDCTPRQAVATFQYNSMRAMLLTHFRLFLLWMTTQPPSFFSAGKEERGKSTKTSSGRISSKQIGEELTIAHRASSAAKDEKFGEKKCLTCSIDKSSHFWPLFAFEMSLSVDQEERWLQAHQKCVKNAQLSLDRVQVQTATFMVSSLKTAVTYQSHSASHRNQHALLEILTPEQSVRFLDWFARNRERCGAAVCGLGRVTTGGEDSPTPASKEMLKEKTLDDICQQLNEVLNFKRPG